MKQRSKVIATSIATIAMCASLAVGGTFALFTSESEVNVAVTAGTVDVKATADKTTLEYTSSLGKPLTESSATIVENVVKIDKIVPGDTISFDLVIENYSNVTVQYQTVLSLVDGVDLFTGLQIEVDEKVYDGMTAYSNWTELKPIDGENKEFDRIPVMITLPENAGNEYQNKTAEISFIVKAVQGNATMEQPASDENTLYVYNANDMKLFAHSVNNGNNFSGKTVMMMSNVDLENEEWTPIGNSTNKFQGTFDGNGKTVSNLYVEGEKGLGLFGYVYSGTYIHDLTIDGAYVSGEDYLGAVVGTGYFSKNGVQNCVVKNAEIIATPYLMDNGDYDGGAKAGVVAGYVNNGNVCGNSALNSSVSAYRDLGGIVGMMSGENWAIVAENNSVENITLTYLAAPNGKYADDKVNENMGDIVGRIKNTTIGNNAVGKMTYNKWHSAADVDGVLADGGEVVLGANVTYSAKNTEANSGYGATGLTVTDGAVLDGNGNTLTVTDANSTWDCAIDADNGTIKNLTVNGSFRGIFMGGASGDVYIDNVVLDKVCYTFNSDAGNKDYGVYISNSTLNGWTSFSDAHKEVVFESCNFGEGTGGYKYAFCRPYNASVFKNCKFAEGFEFDTGSASNKIVFENCYYGDTLITPANAATLCKDDIVFFYNGLNGITINGAKATNASSDTDFNNALTSSDNVAITLSAGSYTMPEPTLQGKTLTITGTRDTVIDVSAVDARDQFVTGATVVFDGVTLNFGTVNYMGFANTDSLTYRNCKINGLQFLFGKNVSFENCEFDSNGAEHCVWTYGAQNVSFKECTFTYGDRGINCYSDNDVAGGQTVSFEKCKFIAKDTASAAKGAVEINSCYITDGIQVNMTDCTAPANGDMVYVSEWDSTKGAKTTVIVDGATYNTPVHTN